MSWEKREEEHCEVIENAFELMHEVLDHVRQGTEDPGWTLITIYQKIQKFIDKWEQKK